MHLPVCSSAKACLPHPYHELRSKTKPSVVRRVAGCSRTSCCIHAEQKDKQNNALCGSQVVQHNRRIARSQHYSNLHCQYGGIWRCTPDKFGTPRCIRALRQRASRAKTCHWLSRRRAHTLTRRIAVSVQLLFRAEPRDHGGRGCRTTSEVSTTRVDSRTKS